MLLGHGPDLHRAGFSGDLAPMSLAIDLDRLRADMLELARIGRVAGRPGINRPSFSDADMAGRRYFMARATAAGLDVAMDVVGNVVARWTVGDGGTVMAGSHLDTVPDGGVYDGTLGCCAALEAVRVMRAGRPPDQPGRSRSLRPPTRKAASAACSAARR